MVQPHTIPDKPEIKYRIVAGHRRYAAFELNQSATIPAFIRTDIKTELQSRELNLIENLERQDLNMLQEANALKYFLRHKDPQTNRQIFNDKELGLIFGKPVNWITTRRMLLELPKEVQEEAAAGILKANHIRKLAQLTPNDQYALVKEIKRAAGRSEKVEELPKHNNHDLMAARPRSKAEVLKMSGKIYDLFGPTIWTRFAAWCAGEISTVTFEMEFAEFCKDEGYNYTPPQEIKNAILGVETKKTPLVPR